MYVQPADRKRFCSQHCANDAKKITGPGARIKRVDGYIQVYYPAHPDATKSGMVLEHRLVMEQKLGRRLLRTEQVNHIDHVRDNNDPSNLEVLSAGAHARETIAHAKKQRQIARDELSEYRRLYGPLPGK
jgi:hypothetical protein